MNQSSETFPPNVEQDVRDFHRKFGHPEHVRPQTPLDSEIEFRIKLIREECRELIEALELRDRVKIAREAVDLIYVSVGTLLIFGIRLAPCWAAVHRANMTKVHQGPHEKPSKPEGWRSPDEDIQKAVSVGCHPAGGAA